MCTKDLSKLIFLKPGGLPEPEHTITGPITHQSRPCRSIYEIQQSTMERTRSYMNPPTVRRQCLFGEVTADKVGPLRFIINRNYDVNDESMQACNF